MEIVKNIAAVIGCISAAIALLTTIIKPLRQAIVNSFVKKGENIELNNSINEIKVDLKRTIDRQIETIARLDKIEKNVLSNESDRLKSELFSCGNRCRRGIILYPEEMGHIRNVYRKYSEVLHQNHDGTLEYEFILDYYNSQNLSKNQ